MAYDHVEPHNHRLSASAEASAPTAAAFRTGRAYKVRGLDCAEEVAVLKQAVGPLVGGADRLAFDVLNGRMTVAANEREVADEAIFKAIAATGMSAVPWTPHAKTDDADNHRRQQVLFTAASGIALLIGFALHVVLARGFAPAWRLLGSQASASMPWPGYIVGISSYRAVDCGHNFKQRDLNQDISSRSGRWHRRGGLSHAPFLSAAYPHSSWHKVHS